jgi:hypothetical protein
MRTIILIAAMVLTSVAAQAGETRGLSTATAPSDAPVTITAKQFLAQNDAPAPVAATPAPATASSTPASSTAQPGRRYDDKGYFDDAGYHPSPRDYSSADRPAEPPRRHIARPHRGSGWTAERIIAELHRYGIDW